MLLSVFSGVLQLFPVITPPPLWSFIRQWHRYRGESENIWFNEMYHQSCYLHIDVCGIHRNVSISFKNPQKHFNNNQTAKIANDPSVLPLAGPTSHRVRNYKFCPPLTKILWAAKKDIWKRLSWTLYLCCVASTTIKSHFLHASVSQSASRLVSHQKWMAYYSPVYRCVQCCQPLFSTDQINDLWQEAYSVLKFKLS